jgi:hypothetical protein
MKWICTLLLCTAPAFAQPAPPAAAANEDPTDVAARVRYERAVRADFDGHADEAIREAQASIEAKPDGRFAEAARALIEKLHGQLPAGIRSTGVGPRTELVITSTFTGLYLGGLAAGAFNADSKGAVALLMLGTGAGLLGSILGSSGKVVPQSMPQFLQNGFLYGTYATALGLAIGDTKSGQNVAGTIFFGAAAGSLAGLLAAPRFTGGDAGAMTTGMIYGGVVPLLIEATVGPHQNTKTPLWTLLIGSTAGLVAGPLVNARAHWSRGRWNLVTLGGGVGALIGGGVGVLSDAFKGEARGGLALLTVGTVAGLGLTAWLSSDFGADEPRPGAAALVHAEGSKLSLGDLPSALSPIRVQEKTGGYLRVAEGRF